MFKALQATSVGIPLGPFLDSTGTPNSGLTITKASVWISKNNSIFALKSHSAACAADSLATGLYQCWLNGTDTGTAGTVRIYCNYSGVIPVWENGEIVTSLDMYTHVAAMETSLVSIAANVTVVNTSLVSVGIALTSIVATNATQTTSLVSIAANALSAVSSASLALTAYDSPTKAEMDALAASTAIAAYGGLQTSLAVALAASTALTVYDAPTKAELDAGLAALNDIAVADIAAMAIDGAIALDDALQYVVSYISGDIIKDSTSFAYYNRTSTLLWTSNITAADRRRV